MTEFQSLLEPQSSVKVVLNGGHHELDDATIPFSIGMHESVAEQQPTHVLVIDIPYGLYEKYNSHEPDNGLAVLKSYSITMCYGGERRIYELNKIDFLQFNSPGKHNLIFVLLKNLTKEKKSQILQKRSFRTEYENKLLLRDIEQNDIGVNVLGYSEALVEIPEHFFALAPKTGFRKAWWSWVNRWFLTKPVDECEFRKRAMLALTLQPVCWLLGFLVRLVYCVLLTPLMIAIGKVFLFLIGGQSFGIFKKLGELNWDFLFLYRKKGWWDMLAFHDYWFEDERNDEYKRWLLFGKIIKLPISPVGLLIQITLWAKFYSIIKNCWLHPKDPLWQLIGFSAFVSYIAAWHLALVIASMPFKKIEKWAKENFSDDKKVPRQIHWLACMPVFATIICAAIARTPWGKILITAGNVAPYWSSIVCTIAIIVFFKYRKKIILWLNRTFPIPQPVYQTPTSGTITGKQVKPKKVKITRAEWLKQNMDINKLPNKVDLKNTAAPTRTEHVFLKFKVSFWRAKSKVCKPYAK